ncbi:sterile alpha motif domain-containing protein 9-like [Hippoglossus hippoglossus]|uniref:sterile alpha motif domain-containing protein 9-like n=1 Tax=Hippoglossus hippoglossus TaxID=8267 RepID=UPI00148C0CAE|nr:sterile alpha motif domain-containing protein 9-like [Hippoglossus hippoglossus]
MERGSPDTESSGADSEMSVEELVERWVLYMNQNPKSTNTQLFCMLALLKAYAPESYLLMSECQKILGPPDPIHGGPPFEDRMEPFTIFIRKSSPNPGHEHVCMIDQVSAQCAVKVMADSGIPRSATVSKMMNSLCGAQAEPHVLQFIKDLLTKREMGRKGKENFSRLVEDILEHESFNEALCVLKRASTIFKENAAFPQVVSRLYYIAKEPSDYVKAEEWAKRAIKRAPDISYIADTLGQVYKNRLLKMGKGPGEIMSMADEAFRAFKDVERKADKEEPPQMDTEGTASFADTFNNRGLFGFLQVAKIALEKLSDQQHKASLIQNNIMEVEDKFEFFEWYLTYSKPDETTFEPPYFWKDVALCYKHYTTRTAAESTSFPGLLDCLNHGLFRSRGKRARFQEEEKSGFDLEEIQRELKNDYEENVDDVKVAERYILSNIILSNRMPDSPQLTSVEELQTIIRRFLDTERRDRSPEFYLLVLLLLFPEEQPPVVQDEDDEEAEQPPTDGQPGQLPLDHGSDSDLQQYVTFMEEAYERSSYAKYLRSRYLLPLFFLGKGSGLSKWIHKSQLDAIVEQTVDAELAGEHDPTSLEKTRRIENMWRNGDVWLVPEIQNILLPVRVEDNKVVVCAGGWKVKVSTEVEPEDPTLSTRLIYLGFNIQGPVLFEVSVPRVNND